MKTILEWFQGFPEPYRTQAIENWKKDYDYDPSYEVGFPEDALDIAFLWEESPQGKGYWVKFYDALSKDIPAPTTGWQPISTAPKDGTTIIACSCKHYVPQSVCWASYHPNAKGKECWRTSAIGGNKAEGLTHWMPLPEPPSVD